MKITLYTYKKLINIFLKDVMFYINKKETLLFVLKYCWSDFFFFFKLIYDILCKDFYLDIDIVIFVLYCFNVNTSMKHDILI